jgi:hypothetical protein
LKEFSNFLLPKGYLYRGGSKIWKDSVKNIVVIFQTNILRIVGFYVRHSASTFYIHTKIKKYCEIAASRKSENSCINAFTSLHRIALSLFMIIFPSGLLYALWPELPNYVQKLRFSFFALTDVWSGFQKK